MDVLSEEKNYIIEYMKRRQGNNLNKIYIRHKIKNKYVSELARRDGNRLYATKNHSEKLHEKIHQFYTKAIRCAPKESEELALAYGNRSALLFHLNYHEECIEDCQRAISQTKDKTLQAKWTCRLAESSIIMDRSSAKDIHARTSKFFEFLPLNRKERLKFLDKLNNIVFNYLESKEEETVPKRDYFYHILASFPHNKEVPRASQSIQIAHNEKWGRHVLASKDIKPGEIIAKETNFCTLNCEEGQYLFCSYCNRFTLGSIPCDDCTEHIYCSNDCKDKSKAEYHYLECPIYQFLWDHEGNSTLALALRLFLVIKHKTGGLDQFKNILEEVESCKNAREKGFHDGVFDTQDPRCFLSLTKFINDISKEKKDFYIEMSCTVMNLFSKYTDFFEEKGKDLKNEDFIQNERVLFSTALFLRVLNLLPYNIDWLTKYDRENNESHFYGLTVHIFSSLINHSCDPNVERFIAKNNTTIIYAKHPIKKGDQIFLNYLNESETYLNLSKESRQNQLNFYNFTCNCLACIENWSKICLPSISQLIKYTPALHGILMEKLSPDNERRIRTAEDLKTIQNGQRVPYDPESIKDAVQYLEVLAEVCTIHCKEYEDFAEYLRCLFQDGLGAYLFEFPENCFKSVDN